MGAFALTPPPDFVLLLSHSNERFCTAQVQKGLENRGARSLRLDTDLFPTELRVSARLGAETPGELLWQGEPLEVSAVWVWRLWAAQLSPKLSAEHQRIAQTEAHAAWVGFLAQLSDAFFIDPNSAAGAAENKLWQLRLAQTLGIPIPETLVTADPQQARSFCSQHDRVVTKLQRPICYGMAGGGGFPTRLVQKSDLAALDSLVHCPMMFQRYIQKKYELRVAWVDGQAFVGALPGEKCGVDWRYEAAAPFEVGSLPGAVHRKLAALMRALGLRQGAIDLIVTPEDDYVFLEVNPNGEWGMLERDLGLPIGQALADALIRRGEKNQEGTGDAIR